MREIKRFFTANTLNRGYGGHHNSKENTHKDSRHVYSQYNNILPPLEIMAQYEELRPGIIDKMIAIAKKEQEHQHLKDNLLLKQQEKIVTYGRIVALLIPVITFAMVFVLAGKNPENKSLSWIINILVISFVAYVIIFSLYMLNSINNINKNSIGKVDISNTLNK